MSHLVSRPLAPGDSEESSSFQLDEAEGGEGGAEAGGDGDGGDGEYDRGGDRGQAGEGQEAGDDLHVGVGGVW